MAAGNRAARPDLAGSIPDPAGLLEWVAKVRGFATFVDARDVRAKQAALAALVREWVRHL